jgi:drug/metabolite transporter (DMT)-like permease
VATIYAIKKAGLAIGIGVGSSFIVLVSFTWGIFVFGEHVHSKTQACTAVACMLCGLAGMAYYSAPTVAHVSSTSGGTGSSTVINIINSNTNSSSACYQPVRPDDPDFLRADQDEEDVVATNYNTDHPPSSPLETDYIAMGDDDNNTSTDTNDREMEEGPDPPEVANGISPTVLCCFGKLRVQERMLGMLAALVFTGIWGGSIMVPMHFAPKVDKGLGYLISFAIGAAIVNLSLWIIRYLYLCYLYSCAKEAYHALPSFHLRKMWLYGGACGILWSIGNFFSILAVQHLGEGVGYSATQASMLVSGLWGIFYFKEIEGFKTISKWLLSASITVVGILLLSYEHHQK